MIDQDKMRALSARLRDESSPTNGGRNVAREVIKEAADAIDLLLAEVEASNHTRKEAILDAEKARDERNRVHVKLNAEWIEKTNALRAELEAAASDKRDALDMVKRLAHEFDSYHYHGCQADKIPPEPCDCFAGALMNEARALAQRQGEGS